MTHKMRKQEKAINFLMGKVMEMSDNKADPKKARECLMKLLEIENGKN